MTSHEDIARALKLRLAELTGRISSIESELRQELPADSEEQAIALEIQDALETLEKSPASRNPWDRGSFETDIRRSLWRLRAMRGKN